MPRVGAQASAKEATGLKPPSFNAPNIVVAEADDAARFQSIDFKRRRTVYKSLYAPFISLLGRHHVDDDHKELPIFVADAPTAFRVLAMRPDGTAPSIDGPNLSRLSNSGYLAIRRLFAGLRWRLGIARYSQGKCSLRREFLRQPSPQL
jgi:hypothetical protein